MKTICAIVSGRVIQCLCQVGDLVEPGDEVLKIESMKMEIPVEAETGGCIATLLVKEGDAVEEGQVLAELA